MSVLHTYCEVKRISVCGLCNNAVSKLECVISGFRRDIDDICALLRYCAALSGSSVPTFRDNLSVSFSRKPLEVGPIGCPETSAQHYHSLLRNIAEERRSQVECVSVCNVAVLTVFFVGFLIPVGQMAWFLG
jgi:hypothetical protein